MTELRIINGGTPTSEELAAVVAVLASRAAAQEAVEAPLLRPPLSPWVASGLVKGTRTKV